MRTRLFWVLVLEVACLTVLAGQAGAGVATLGQTGVPGASFGAGIYVQPTVAGGNSYTVPSLGKWMIKSWSTQAGPSGGHLALVVLRPSEDVANQYEVVGVSPVHNLTPNVRNTFRTQTRTKHDDLIGLWADASAAALFATTDLNDHGFGLPVSLPPSAGATISVSSFSFSGYRTNISVTMKRGRGS